MKIKRDKHGQAWLGVGQDDELYELWVKVYRWNERPDEGLTNEEHNAIMDDIRGSDGKF